MRVKGSPAVKAEAFELIERLHFLSFIWGRQAPGIDSLPAADLAIQVATESLSLEALVRQLKNIFDSSHSELLQSSLRELAKDKGYYGWRAVKYFLYEYEQHLREKSKTEREKVLWEDFSKEIYDEDFASIEHIYPQKASDIYWTSRFKPYTTKERNLLRHSLGNLLALSKPKNSSLRNGCFDSKKGKPDSTVGYCFGGYSENEVGRETEWTALNILERGVRLLEFMERRWKVDLGSKKDKIRILGLDFVLQKDPSISTKPKPA